MRHKHRPVFTVNGISIWHTPAKRNRPTTRIAQNIHHSMFNADGANAVALYCVKELNDIY